MHRYFDFLVSQFFFFFFKRLKIKKLFLIIKYKNNDLKFDHGKFFRNLMVLRQLYVTYMKICHKMKEKLDIDIPWNFQTTQICSDNVIREIKQQPPLHVSTNTLLQPSWNLKKQSLTNCWNFFGRTHESSLAWLLLVSVFKKRSKQDFSLNQ